MATTQDDFKPVREWLKELPDGYRELALGICENPDREVASLANAIDAIGLWRDTPQGEDFWADVCTWAINPEHNPLPPLPYRWMQEGNNFFDSEGNSFHLGSLDGRYHITLKDIPGETFTAPTASSAMKMVEAYISEP